jgi:hypothetical protein
VVVDGFDMVIDAGFAVVVDDFKVVIDAGFVVVIVVCSPVRRPGGSIE